MLYVDVKKEIRGVGPSWLLLLLLLLLLFTHYRDIGPAVRVFANGPSHTKDFKNGTWYHLA